LKAVMQQERREATRDAFVLEIPPSPQFVGTARLFAASIARHFGFDQESVEDIKVAVSEACTSVLLSRDAEGRPVRLNAWVEKSMLAYEIAGIDWDANVDASAEEWIGDRVTPSPGLELVRALFPDAEIRTVAGSATLRFSIPLPAND
jgi:hypothetical protein